MRYPAFLLLSLTFSCTAFAAGPAQVAVSVIPGKMRYDVESFNVEPGAAVSLTLTNGDSMQHNLVICKPGADTGLKVAQAAWALGAAAPARQYIPDNPDILFHTHLVDPNSHDTVTFTAPAQEADYPYVCTMPGHAMLMKGIMHVHRAAAKPEPYIARLQDIQQRIFPGAASLEAMTKSPLPAAVGRPGDKFNLGAISDSPLPYGVAFEGTLVTDGTDPLLFHLAGDTADLSVDGQTIASSHHGISEARVPLVPGKHAIVLREWSNQDDQNLTATVRAVTGLKTINLIAPRPHREILTPGAEPLVERAFLPDAPSGVVAVGFPSRFNYCFDPQRCALRYYWIGRFLDVDPVYSGRGGQPANPMGARVSMGDTFCPLKVDANDRPEVRFLGYFTGALPQMCFSADGQVIEETIAQAVSPQGVTGLLETFNLPSVHAAVRFVAPAPGMQISSADGTVVSGVLSIDAAHASHFSVTIFPAR